MPSTRAATLAEELAERRERIDPRYRNRTLFAAERGMGVAHRVFTALEQKGGPARKFDSGTEVVFAVAYDVPLDWLRNGINGKGRVRPLGPDEHFTAPSGPAQPQDMLQVLARLIPDSGTEVPGVSVLEANMAMYGKLAAAVPLMAERLRLAAEGPDGSEVVGEAIRAIITSDATPKQREFMWRLFELVAARAGLDPTQQHSAGLVAG